MDCGSSGEVPREGRSPFFSIESETKSAVRLKFVFNEGANKERYLTCVSQAIQLLRAHHSGNTPDPFQNAPVNEARNTIYMLYDDDRQIWYAADIYEEIKKIATESRAKQSKIET